MSRKLKWRELLNFFTDQYLDQYGVDTLSSDGKRQRILVNFNKYRNLRGNGQALRSKEKTYNELHDIPFLTYINIKLFLNIYNINIHMIHKLRLSKWIYLNSNWHLI